MALPSTPDWIVVTTIHEPRPALGDLLARLGESWGVVVVGDVRTPPTWNDWPVVFLSLERQLELFGAFAATAPRNHYARKNFGYLYARRRGATCILETDDDNAPYPTFATRIALDVEGRLVGGGDWANVYAWFTERPIWPRGLPLDALRRRGDLVEAGARRACAVQQYLVDDDPDVDAIHRLVFGQTDFAFDADAAPVILQPGTWCPFNSQNTLWLEAALPLLYLPHHCSMRVADIWRSLVAQRALWLHGGSIAFHPSSARQERNPHDLLRDFADEVPGYTGNRAIAQCLDRAAAGLAGRSIADAGRGLWSALVAAGFLPGEEMALIESWFGELATPA